MAGIRTLLTFEEFEQLPDRPGKDELLRGELIQMPPAKLRHNKLAERFYDWLKVILAHLHARREALQLGTVHHEMGYHIAAHSWFVPDVSITRAGQLEGDYYEGAPALAVEILSEFNRPSKVAAKIKDYLANGGLEVWVIHRDTRHAVIHRIAVGAVPVSGRFQSELLPGVIIDLDELLGPAE